MEREGKKKPTWRCFTAFSLFFSSPRSNKFTQQRGTAPIGPGKEEQEEGDQREGGRREEDEGVKGRREGGLEGWIQAPLAQRVSRRKELSAGQGSSPAPPYGPAGP